MRNTPASQDSTPLRIGIHLPSLVVPSWVAHIIRAIQASPLFRLSLVLLEAGARRSIWQRLNPRRWAAALFGLYEAVDYRLMNAEKDSLAPIDLRDDLRAVATLRVQPAANGPPAPVGERDRAQIQAADLDVLLVLGPEGAGADLLDCARYGVWSVLHRDSRAYSGGPSLFWEIHEQQVVAATEIHVRAVGAGAPRIIARSFSRVSFYSLNYSRNLLYWKSAALLLRSLGDLQRYGWESLQSRAPCTEGATRPANRPAVPGNLTMLRFLARLVGKAFHRWVRLRLFKKQWLLAVRRRGAASAPATNGTGFRLLTPPPDRYYADPFIIQKGGSHYVFFEDYPYAKPKGLISCLEIDPSGNPGAPRVVLERDYHLSYPFVFEWQGQTYLLPETSANRTVELYRAVEFPHRWELDRVLIRDVGLTDATLLYHGGRFWLFASPQGQAHSVNDELNLYFADSPLGPWTPHPRNPIVADVRRARPAGRVLRVNGRLFRPAQDCSVRYGYAVSFQQIDVLTETAYEESCAGRLEPCWLPGNLATHTFNHNEEFEVVDAQLEVPRYAWLPRWRRRTRRGACVTTPREGSTSC
jgi:hypothetical protein